MGLFLGEGIENAPGKGEIFSGFITVYQEPPGCTVNSGNGTGKKEELHVSEVFL